MIHMIPYVENIHLNQTQIVIFVDVDIIPFSPYLKTYFLKTSCYQSG